MDGDFMNKARAWLARRININDQEILQMSVNLAKESFTEALRQAPNEFGDPPLPLTQCEICKGKGVLSEVLDIQHGEWVRELLEERPEPDESLDQAPVEIEQMFMDTAFILNRLSDEEAFLFIGDDDFHSIILARFAPWLDIKVLDADSRIVAGINIMSEKYTLKVQAFLYNACEDLPHSLVNSCDAFYCDPPYSSLGVHLFASRGISALKPDLGTWGLMAIPMTLLPREVRLMLHDFQKFLLLSGFVILETVPAHKLSSHSKGVISGLLKFERVREMSCPVPTIPPDNLYSHFY